MAEILSIIPARGGSKGVPKKNIRILNGKPLIAYTIEVAKKCGIISRIIVSTDDLEIAEISKKYGAEVPFLRPGEFATDQTPDRPVFLHALSWLQKNENYYPEFVLNLRPTAPFRSIEDIENVIQCWIKTKADSVRTVTRVDGVHHPYWMYIMDKSNFALPLIDGKSIEEYYQRQLLPPVYRLNGVVDGMRTDIVMSHEKLYGDKMALVEVPESRAFDIDTIRDFMIAECLIKGVVNEGI